MLQGKKFLLGLAVLSFLVVVCRAEQGVVEEMEVQNNGISEEEKIHIYNPATATTEQVPLSFSETWPTWVLYDGKQKEEIVKIPSGEDGFVNPVSYEDFWLPLDLEYPEMRMALGFHIREGQIRQIMPAVDFSYARKHQNRGLCTVPRARYWIEVANIDWEEYELIVTQRWIHGDNDWQIIGKKSIESFWGRMIEYIAETPPEEWKEGSHIVHVVLDDTDSEVMPCTKVKSELAVSLGKGLEMHGKLKVKVSATSAGSESEFLPDAYKPLFEDKTYQRSKYFEFKRKRAATKEKIMEAQPPDAEP
mmetsp:Transcript_11855/g.18344  ORF Transcript_11855/g.18344 Transcript_11855/m.18344 type:complete len:305 (+) Transcript_11855:88-1002(+)